MIDRYLDAVIAEIDMEPDFGQLDAVNFGGGTPSTLDPGSVEAVLDRVSARFGIASAAEIM